MRKIPFYRPEILSEEIDLVSETLRSGWITTGPRVLQLEEALCGYTGADHAVCFSSATAAMEMMLRDFGIGPGDRVITTPCTYAATVNVILHCGAEPVLADTLPDSWEIDPDAVAAALDSRTKAVMPVDFAGWPCDFDRIAAVLASAPFSPSTSVQEALGRPLLLCDAAHSLGSRYHGERLPRSLDAAAYSFHAVKNVTTAEGGALVFREKPGVLDGDTVRRLKTISLHGQDKSAFAKYTGGGWEYDILTPGFKCNLSDIHAALGVAQLSRYPEMLRRRRAISARYNASFSTDPRLIVPPFDHVERESAWHIYPLRLADAGREDRDRFIREMEASGIGVNVHFRLIPDFSAYRGLFSGGDWPNARVLSDSEVTLPLYPGLDEEDVSYIIDTVFRVLDALQEQADPLH